MRLQLAQALEGAFERRLRRVLRVMVIGQHAEGARVHTGGMPADEFAEGVPVVTLRTRDQDSITEPLQVVGHIHIRRRRVWAKSANGFAA